MGNIFLTLNKLYKTLFVNLFFVRIDPVPLSLVVSDISRMLGRNILISTCSFTAVHFLGVMSYIHYETDLLHNLLVILSVSSGKAPVFNFHKFFSKQFVQKIEVKQVCGRVLFSVCSSHIACKFSIRRVVLQGFLWRFLKLLGQFFFRTSLSSYRLCNKTCKKKSNYYLLVNKNSPA